MKQILVIDNDASFLLAIKNTLEYNRYKVETLENPLKTLDYLQNYDFDCVLLDVAMPGMNGLDLLEQICALHPLLPVVMVSGESTISIAVDAIKQGAYDFLEKPIDTKRLLITIEKAIEKKSWAIERNILLNEISETYEMVGRSRAIQRIFDTILTVAPSEAKVLILGETGTGKELVARAIHHKSPRSGKKFVALNCAAIPETLLESELFGHKKGSFSGAAQDRIGKFQAADGGTLFLDEIGELPLAMQAKLLRVLDNNEIEVIGLPMPQKVDVRILAATNKNLEKLIEKGRFRSDLYHRLNVVTIEVPPLRTRPEDIKILAEYFLQKFSQTYNKKLSGFTESAMQRLLEYDWPGNVRELKNIVEKISIFTKHERIQASDVFIAMDLDDKTFIQSEKTPLLREAVDQFEHDYILRALIQNEWKIQQTAGILGLERTTLFKKMRKYGLNKAIVE